MSSPSAAAPVAVLVLAWDETTPAVRTLVEATEVAAPLVDSVVVVVPAGEGAIEELTQEEFLPLPELPASPTPEAAAPAEAAADTAPTSPTALTLPPTSSERLPAPAPGRPLAASAAPAQELERAALTSPTPPVVPKAPAAPTLAWEVVRVLRLSSFSLPSLAAQAGQPLPAPAWTGTPSAPAAPYVGTTVAGPQAGRPVRVDLLLDNALPYPAFERRLILATTLLRPPLLAGDSVLPVPQPAGAEALPPTYLQVELPSLGADLEEPELSLPPADELADEAGSLYAEAEEQLPTDFAPAQASWTQALASLQQPAAMDLDGLMGSALPEATTEASGAARLPAAPHPALRPAAGSFEAPNLNFQVIQYARFAVPVALAEQPYGVLYAPAWPTWLAAQELRQRTGQPLVLHVATLAAADDESVETATGWVAELQRQVLRRADLILTETPALAHRLREELSLPAAAVRAVAATDADAIAHALHTAHVRPLAG